MNVCVVGGGNIGTVLLGDIAFRNHTVNLLTGKPEKWSYEIQVIDLENHSAVQGKINKISDDMALLSEADVILSTLPSNIFRRKIKEYAHYITPHTYIGIVPGSGGCEFCCQELIKKDCVLFGFQRVHSIARVKEYGKSVYVTSRKPEIQIGAIPRSRTKEVCEVIKELLGVPVRALDNYLAVTLTPSNPILHTTRLYSMFRDYKEGIVYDRNMQFYSEWTDEASQMLIDCDRELQIICGRFEKINLQEVVSLKKHYGVNNTCEMTNKIKSIPAFQNILSPMEEKGTGFIPDRKSRYFQEDFPYGLCIIKAFGLIAGVDTPNIDIVLKWYEEFAGVQYFEKKQFTGKDLKQLNIPQNYGLFTIEEICDFYQQ